MFIQTKSKVRVSLFFTGERLYLREVQSSYYRPGLFAVCNHFPAAPRRRSAETRRRRESDRPLSRQFNPSHVAVSARPWWYSYVCVRMGLRGWGENSYVAEIENQEAGILLLYRDWERYIFLEIMDRTFFLW